MQTETTEVLSGFGSLTPDVVIGLVERAVGVPCSNLCRSLTSYINRVFELRTESGEGVIAKFYRPGRWERDSLQDEHDFLLELAAEEIPVVPPIVAPDGSSLHESDGMFFALFPKKLGRACDEPTYEQWEELGRLLARVHVVGARHLPRNRITMTPGRSTTANAEYILRHAGMPPELRRQYEEVVHKLIGVIEPMFQGVALHRIHGDCHQGNIVHRPDESLYLIDFDDMAVGPAVQDFWMLLPGYSKGSLPEIDTFLEGYGLFRDFDRSTLKLIEPLRAMRYIHFTAWCAVQVADGGFARLQPNWGTPAYWTGEIRELNQQIEEIHASAEFFGRGQFG